MADYADCGFGSSGTAPAAGSGAGTVEPPATAVEVESAVLEHFPEEQREDAPFPTKVRAPHHANNNTAPTEMWSVFLLYGGTPRDRGGRPLVFPTIQSATFPLIAVQSFFCGWVQSVSAAVAPSLRSKNVCVCIVA